MATCSGSDPKVNTLEDLLKHFRRSHILKELDESLEKVRRNKRKQEHQECFNKADKILQKICLIVHPDRVRNRRGLYSEAAAQKLQSALNASRMLLKFLTEAFLEDISIDYKYEYFVKLEISSLANENEIDRRIRDVFYKISELSEIKRLNIVGEIRKFLLESQQCVKSYLERNKGDFLKYCDYSLYHLNKCIAGYQQLQAECNLLEKECRDENDENIRSVILKVGEQSSGDLRILRSLESVARNSLNGNFQIFTIEKPMDEYFVEPFVYYVNVLSMCNVMLEERSKFSSGFQYLKRGLCELSGEYLNVNPYLEKLPTSFARAYHLAAYFKDKNHKREVQKIMKDDLALKRTERKYVKRDVAEKSDDFIPSWPEDKEIRREIVKEKFDETLTEIMVVLGSMFTVDSYCEGKSNREELNERLSRLMKKMADFEVKEKEIRENIRMYKKENAEIRREYHYILEKNAEKTLENLENINASHTFPELLLNYAQNTAENEDMFKSEDQENSWKRNHILIEDGNETGQKIQKSFEQNAKASGTCLELPLSYDQNVTKVRSTFKNEGQERKGGNDDILTEDGKDFGKRTQEILKQNIKDSETTSQFLINCDQNVPKDESVLQNEDQEIKTESDHIVALDRKEFDETIQENLKQCNKIGEQLCELLLNCKRNRNITERNRMFGDEGDEKWKKYIEIMEDSEEMEKKIQEVKEMSNNVSEMLLELLSWKQDETEITRPKGGGIEGISTENTPDVHD